MANAPISDKVLNETLKVFNQCGGNQTHAATKMGISRSALQNRLRHLNAREGVIPSPLQAGESPTDQVLRQRIRALESQLAMGTKEDLTAKYIKTQIIKLSEAEAQIPDWVISPKGSGNSPGVPTLLCSDWHWGEVVRPEQINHVNEYNLSIAQDRARRVIEKTIDLLENHVVNPDYPGIVLCLGGDMISGDIHEELVATNEIPVIPSVIDLWGTLAWCIDQLRQNFGKVFVVAVTGNHGRNTKKIQHKDRNGTSFDWLIYQFLNKRFENDQNVTFHIPDGSDALFSIFGHRYLLTHGDKLGGGGDGIIGMFGPVIRGDHRRRGRNGQIDLEYDTMICGHYHQLVQTRRVIVNGSLVGYNEYAYDNAFPFEQPQQALWITHPEQGITISMPVHLGEKKVSQRSNEWVSWVK